MDQHGGKRIGAGRKKEQRTLKAEQARAYIIEEVTKSLKEILAPQIEKAKAGEFQSYQDLVNRAYGKPKETIEANIKLKGLVLDI